MRSFTIIVACAYIAFTQPLPNQTGGAQRSEGLREENATAGQSANQNDMGDIAEQWKLAYNSGQAARVAALYCEDGYYLSAHILAHGRADIQAYWQRGITAGGHIDFIKPLVTFASGDLGYTAGTYQATNA